MRALVKIPAGGFMKDVPDKTIRPLFHNTGIAGYFLICCEIPCEAFDIQMPAEDYFLIITDERIPRKERKSSKIGFPTLQETLWAIGWAGVELTNIVCQKPVRFLHPAFPIPHSVKEMPDVWRQVCMRRADGGGTRIGYFVETVSAEDKSQDFLLAYVLARSELKF